MKFKSTILLLLVIAFIVAVAGCAGSDNPKNESQMASTPTQTVSTPSAGNQDAQWVSLMQTQSAIIQADLNAISSTQTPNAKDPFDAENLSKAGQKLVDDTNTAITENDKYTVSDTLKVAQKYWRMALQNYNEARQSQYSERTTTKKVIKLRNYSA